MSINLKLLDSFKLTGNLVTNFACARSDDDRVFIIAQTGLYIITQTPNLNSVFADYGCHKFFLKPSPFAVCDNVDIDINSFAHELPKDVIFESAAYAELTQHLKAATPAPPSVLYAQWSDANMVDNLYNMLGVLTNLHSLEIYIKSINESNAIEYKMVLNLTKEILERRKGDFIYSAKLPPLQKIRELKKRVEYIAPTTFEWSHTFGHEGQNCAVIFVGHFSGYISVWRIFSANSSDRDTKCNFLCKYKSKLEYISALHWHRTTEYGGALCIGDSEGRITVLQMSNLDKQECSVDNEIAFFTEKDRQVDKITVMTFENYTILIAVKQCYMLIYGLDITGKVFDFMVHNVDNFYITGITHNSNVAKVLTFTGAFKELRVSVHFNKITIEEENIPVKFDFSGYRTHGFVESGNKILFSFMLGPCRLKNSIRGKKFINFCLFNNINISPLKLLLENKTESLRTFWDCFETLRLSCLKEQRFPWLGINSNLELDNLSITKLKTYRLIAQISETVFSVIKRVVTYEIKPYILLHYLVDIKLIIQRLTKLFKDRAEGKELSLFELRSIELQIFFLKEMVVGGVLSKAQVGTKFINEISHILAIANEIKYPDMIQCIFCGEKLIGSMCLPPHGDSRCVFTMMPIFLVPAYKCIICNSLAHNKVAEELERIFCPYCDYPMEKICLNENIKKNMDNFEKVFNENKINSKCLSDCFKDCNQTLEELNLNLEDNQITVVNISDDEDKEVTKNELKELYFKIGNMKLDNENNVGSSSKT